MRIYNEDCITGSKDKLADDSVDLMICDPPFGIGEGKFDDLYARKKDKVFEGYIEAPDDYATFSRDWLTQARRVLKGTGSIYIISGWTNLVHILNALDTLQMPVINHIIWKYNFGCNTSRKFVTSHYHVIYAVKSSNSKPKFNTYCRFGQNERHEGGSLVYRDLEDVWCIHKEYQPGKKKNKNKLPDELVKKIIQYSSDPEDLVCDFFLGNFTTAYIAVDLGRNICGFELNPDSFDYHIEVISSMKSGEGLKSLKVVESTRPENQGKPITEEEEIRIIERFKILKEGGETKKDSMSVVGDEFGRGRFSILNILKKHSL